jgi:dihydroxyacetone kinase-like protein
MGVALAPCTIPAAGRPTFHLAEGEMEIGMGIHGEPSVRSAPLATAGEIAKIYLTELFSGSSAP